MKKSIKKHEINKAKNTYAILYHCQCGSCWGHIVKKGGVMTPQDWKHLRVLMGVKTPFYHAHVGEVHKRNRRTGEEEIKLERRDGLCYLDNEEVAKELKLEEIDVYQEYCD
mgnify:CR=1 FL=1